MRTRIASRQELEDMRGEDYIVCLLCGESFAVLGGTHLGRFHRMGHKKYRRLFNIPANFPLCSVEYSRRSAENAERLGLLSRPGGLAPGLKALGQKGGRNISPDYMRAEAAERRRGHNKTLTRSWYEEHGRTTAIDRRREHGRFARAVKGER